MSPIVQSDSDGPVAVPGALDVLARRLAGLRTAEGRQQAWLRLASPVVQWCWWLPGIPRSRVGLGDGPYTWLREARHRRLERPLTITLLEYPHPRRTFGRLMAAWINDNSAHFRARVNREVDAADVVWVFSQDPLDPTARTAVDNALQRARPDAVLVNAPEHYNAYHEPWCFPSLAEAGVSVPRSQDELEHGKPAVYKRIGEQQAQKSQEPFSGARPGFRAFEFVDGWKDDGFHRYRAFYLFGAVRPSKLQVSRDWNVCLATSHRLEYGFEATAEEERQIGLIARTLGLDFVAVDYVRRQGDGPPVFLDINVYPTVRSVQATRRLDPAFGVIHTFDTRSRLGIPEPTGRPVAELFDTALLSHLARSGRTAARRADSSKRQSLQS